MDGLEAREGLVAAGYYGYLQGVDNEMADMFVPADVKPRLAKAGRVGDLLEERPSEGGAAVVRIHEEGATGPSRALAV